MGLSQIKNTPMCICTLAPLRVSVGGVLKNMLCKKKFKMVENLSRCKCI